MGGVFFILMIVVVIVVVSMGISMGKKADEAWQHAASQLGLRFTKSGFLSSRRIEGRLDELSVCVDTFTRQHGKNNRVTYTRFRVNYPSLRLGLKITVEGFWSGVTKFFGSQDIEVGDSDFDGTAVVKARSKEQVREFLTSSRRLRIRRFLLAHPETQIDDQSIVWSQRGLIRDTTLIIRLVNEIHALGRQMTEDDTDKPLQAALDATNQGHSIEAIEILSDHRKELETAKKPADSDEQLLEAELLYLSGNRDEAKERVDDALQQTPDDDELQEWADALAQDESPRQVASVDEGGLTVQEVCKTLFGSGNTSYRATREFETHYEGQTVRWTGRVSRVERYSYDLVFGSGPGCRCIVDLSAELQSVLGEQSVSAIVQFPQASLDELTRLTDQPLSFRGTLRKVDGLLRKIYISDASRA